MTDLVVRHAEGIVGLIERDGTQTNFTYSDTWRSHPGATPLSVPMPLTARRHSQAVIEPFLWNLLPDNDRVLARWGRQFAVTTSHPYGLIEAVGEDLPGAMTIVGADAPTPVAAAGEQVDWLTNDDVAGLLAAVRADSSAWISTDSTGQWSLAGAQPKIALLHDETTGWGRPSGPTPTTHIIKPAVAGLDDHDLNEHLCLAAARRLGLTAASSEIATFGSEQAIVVERYDRKGTRRLHQEDLCQALGVHPETKYQNEGGPSAVDIISLFRRIMQRSIAAQTAERFIDALLFNWLIGGSDAHAKNYSLLLQGNAVRLAPLYDVASALPYDDIHVPKIKSAMKIGSHYKIASISRRSWEQLAADADVDATWIIRRGLDLAGRITDAFIEAAAQPAVTELESPLVPKLLAGIRAQSADCIRRLT